MQLDPAKGEGSVFVWTYTDKRGGFWAPDNHLYPGMSNGKWRFPIPGDWNLKTPAVVAVPEREFEGPLIPPAWRRFLTDEYGDMENLFRTDASLHFRLRQVYVPLHTDWLEPEKRKAGKKKGKAVAAEMAEGSRRRPLAELSVL